MMRITVPQRALASVLDSSMATYRPERYSGPANPVGDPLHVTRSVIGSSGPRVLHPRLNKSSWSYSYAQEPEQAKPRRKGVRRYVRDARRGRRRG